MPIPNLSKFQIRIVNAWGSSTHTRAHLLWNLRDRTYFWGQRPSQSSGFGPTSLGRVPREQKMLTGYLPRVVYHQVYNVYEDTLKGPEGRLHVRRGGLERGCVCGRECGRERDSSLSLPSLKTLHPKPTPDLEALSVRDFTCVGNVRFGSLVH